MTIQPDATAFAALAILVEDLDHRTRLLVQIVDKIQQNVDLPASDAAVLATLVAALNKKHAESAWRLRALLPDQPQTIAPKNPPQTATPANE